MELRVLGPLEVRVGAGAVALGARKQQVVLGLLAVNANRVVALDELVDEVWPHRPPSSAVANMRSYAASLRRRFESVEGRTDRLVRCGSGYLLRAEPDEVDLERFSAHRDAGRDARSRRDVKSAVSRLAGGLACWRGPVLAGLPRGPQLQARCLALEEDRLAVTEELADLYLTLGQPDQSVALLTGHVREHPLRERAYALLIRALCWTGDVAGALSRYLEVRTALVRELGVEPGRELQDLHRAILNREIETSPPPAVTVGAAVPRELPPEASAFVGRTAEGAQISATLAGPPRPGRSRPGVVVLYGAGGVGKSALAVRVGHALAGRFPDGQLYVDLLGSTPGMRPLTATDVLARFLRTLGVPSDEMPPATAGAAALWRTVTAERRLLIVLDNASDSAQVAALLPASAGCAVLVTSRSPLPALDADRRVRLAGLSEQDAVGVLRLVAPDAAVDPETAHRIATLCDHLPLALRVAAGRLTGRPDLSAREFADRLADHRNRLNELELDGLGVRWCIRVGYDALATNASRPSQLAARAFRAVGLLNVPDISPAVVAAMLAEPDPDLVRAALDLLVTTQLLEPVPGGRYRLHDLVRLVAAERAVDEDPEPDRTTILHRGIAYYAYSMRSADKLLRPLRQNTYDHPPMPTGLDLPRFSSTAQARAWIATELRSVTAAADQALDLPGETPRLILLMGELLWRELWLRHERHALHRVVLRTVEAGRRQANPQVAAWGHLALGRTEADWGNLDTGLHHLEQALALHRAMGDVRGVVLSLNALGCTHQLRGEPVPGHARFAEGLTLAREHDLTALEALILENLGLLEATTGKISDALGNLRRSLDLFRGGREDLSSTAAVLANLAIVHSLGGEQAEAMRCADESIAVAREVGDQFHEHEALLARSEAHLRAGDLTAATADISTVLELSRARGHGQAEATALWQQSKVDAMTGHPAAADLAQAEAQAQFSRLQRRLPTLWQELFAIQEQPAHEQPASA